MAKSRNKKKNRKEHRKENVEYLNTVSANMAAMREGPQKKTWSTHDIKQIQPMTETQKDFFHAYLQDSNIIAYGSAGTGKTFLALYLALRDIIDPDMPQQKLIIVRSAVPSREIGHLPGTTDEKMAEYETPYYSICAELFKRGSTYTDMKEAGLIEFKSTSFIRGETWDNCIVVVDEVQNLSWHENDSIVTRMGTNSRVIFTGDTKQSDLNHRKSDTTGMLRLIRTTERMKEFSSVKFTSDDIVRSKLVKSWIIASEATE